VLLAGLVVVKQGEIEICLATEVVIEAADAGPSPRDDVGDVGIGKAASSKGLAGRREQ
jgi:hypothetical protein